MIARFEIFKSFQRLVADFSTRADGDMKLRDATSETMERRDRFFARSGVTAGSVVSIAAAHAADVIRVGSREAGATMRNVDGLCTGEPGVFLSVTAADCLVLYLYDPETDELALLHAGWRGLARGIVSKALRQFIAPERVRVAVSPFIRDCHFEVAEDVLSAFSVHTEAVIMRDGKTFVDLGAIVLRQLLEAGVNSEYIEMSDECTACLPDRYFSYRRDGEPLETMVAVLGIRK